MKILCKGDVFSVDRERAFRKIKEDMVTEPGAWFREVVANAIDAQHGMDVAPPIEIELRKQDNSAECVVTDAGEGMDDDHLLAFHYMGRTTKRGDAASKDAVIGRFGLGFISVFADRNRVGRITIDTRAPGGAARCIEIRNPGGNELPDWRLIPHGDDTPEQGTRFRFRLAAGGSAPLGKQIAAFCAQTIVPVRHAGRIYRHTPRALAAEDGGQVVEAADEDRSVEVWCAVTTTSCAAEDRARIYLRGMPAEQGSAHLVFGNGGDKMAQNCYGRPYLPSESIVVVSRIGEPTLARDKMLRNPVFERIKTVVNTARAKAVAATLGGSMKRSEHVMENTYLANLYTLGSHLAAHLEGREYPAAYSPAVTAVARHPYFAVYDSTTQVSLEELFGMRNTKHAVFLHAYGNDVACQFIHTAPVTLKEDTVLNSVFGGYMKRLCSELLGSVFGYLKCTEPRPSLCAMEEVLGSTTLAAQLEEKGVISRQDYRVEQVDIEDPGIQAWFEAVRTTLNRTWFCGALSAYDEIRTIRLIPVKIVAQTPSAVTDVLAMQLNIPGVGMDEVTIGLRVDCAAARTLAAAGTQRETLLPTVVQIASCISRHHFGRFILNQENTTELACTQELLIETIGLEDRVIHRALRHLSGGEEEVGGVGKGCVVL
jgi:hypothetical protein